MSVRMALRERTRAAHARLDGLWDLATLRERAGYTRFLQANAAALIPLERRLGEVGVVSLLPDWPARTRSAAIADDLKGLGAVVRLCPAPSLGSAAEQLGAIYVLEGSRLGGALIARAVAQSVDDAVLANRRYLGHGTAGALWQGFVSELERWSPAVDGLCAGATAAFALFEGAARQAFAEAHDR